MRRNILHRFTFRLSLVTSFMLVLAAVLPLVALAGSGDPLGCLSRGRPRGGRGGSARPRGVCCESVSLLQEELDGVQTLLVCIGRVRCGGREYIEARPSRASAR